MSLVDRWYNILHILESKSSISQKELTRKLDISSQTLTSNINLLNKELKNIANIFEKESNYFIKVMDSEIYESILSGKLKRESDFNSVSKRGAFILKEIIESDTSLLIDDISEQLNVSRNTVINDVNKLREKVKFYDLKIIGKPNVGLKIMGEEHKIRLAYVNIVLDYFPIEHIKSETKNIIRDEIIENKMSNQVIALLFKVIEVTYIRTRNNKNIEYEILDYQNFLVESNLFNRLIIFLETEFELTLNNYEKKFLSYPLNIYNQGSGLSKNYDFIFVEKLYNQIIEQIQESFAVDIDQNLLFEEMKIHLLYLINRLAMRIKTRNISIATTDSKYPLSHAMSEVAGKAISKKIGVPLSSIEISYLSLYFEMALSQKNKIHDKEIAVICHTGHGTSKIIKRQIQNALGSSVKVTSYSESEVNEKILNKYFAVFSTIPLRYKKLNKPIIQLSPFFDDLYLQEQWEKVKRTKIIDTEHIKINITQLQENRSYEQNLDLMVDELVNKKYVDDEFKDRIFEREKIKSTIFGNGIAMPHAVNTGINELVLSVGQFKKTASIMSDKDKITLVFMLAIPEDSDNEIENLLLDIYDFIFTVGHKNNLKEDLLKIDSIDHFKEIIKKELMI